MENLVVDRLAYHPAEVGIVHHLVHEGEPAETCGENVRGMGAVQETDFSRTVGRLIVGNHNLEPRVNERQFFRERLRAFDHEEMEDFTAVDQIVVVTEFRFDFCGFGARISGNDTVYECIDEQVGLIDPCGEFRGQIPVLSLIPI